MWKPCVRCSTKVPASWNRCLLCVCVQMSYCLWVWLQPLRIWPCCCSIWCTLFKVTLLSACNRFVTAYPLHFPCKTKQNPSYFVYICADLISLTVTALYLSRLYGLESSNGWLIFRVFSCAKVIGTYHASPMFECVGQRKLEDCSNIAMRCMHSHLGMRQMFSRVFPWRWLPSLHGVIVGVSTMIRSCEEWPGNMPNCRCRARLIRVIMESCLLRGTCCCTYCIIKSIFSRIGLLAFVRLYRTRDVIPLGIAPFAYTVLWRTLNSSSRGNVRVVYIHATGNHRPWRHGRPAGHFHGRQGTVSPGLPLDINASYGSVCCIPPFCHAVHK